MTTQPKPGDIVRQPGRTETYLVAEVKPEKVSTRASSRGEAGHVIPACVYCHTIESNTRDGIRTGSFHAFDVDDVVIVGAPRTRRATRAKPSRTKARTPRRRVPPKR